ncbi:MAG: polymorphic toxin type 46 domain-containing protein [Alphaproteobacteria bacterium]
MKSFFRLPKGSFLFLVLVLGLSMAAAQPGGAQSAPTADQVAVAKAAGASADQLNARVVVASYFYASTDLTTARYADDAKGIDFSKPLEVIDIAAGTTWFQYVRTGYDTVRFGNFFSPVVTATPDCLGISGTGRAGYKAVLPTGQGLKSVAAPIVDSWTTPGTSVQTKGGCAQVVVPNSVKAGVNSGGLAQ